MQSTPGTQRRLVFRLGCFAVASFFLGRGLYDALSTESLLRASIAADGRIVAIDQVHRVHRNGYTCVPVFTFTLEDGKPFTVASRHPSNPPEFKLGQRVRIYYQRDHPEWAVINSLGQLWMGDVALGFVGLVFAGLGAVLSGTPLFRSKVIVRSGDSSH